MICNRQTFSGLFVLPVLLSMAPPCLAEELIPDDECIVELTLPEGATVEVDGKDCGEQREFVFSPLERNRVRQCEFAIRYPSGSISRHKILAHGGRRVRIAKVDPGDSARALHIVPQLGHGSSVGSIAVGDGGRYAISAEPGSALLWNLDKGRLLRSYGSRDWPECGAVEAVDLSHDEQFAALGGGNGAVIISIAENRLVCHLEGHDGCIKAIAFSVDGRYVLTGGGDNTVRLWNTKSGRELRQMRGHSRSVLSVCFSPDGKKALTAAYDGTAILWNLESGRALQHFRRSESELPPGKESESELPPDAIASLADVVGYGLVDASGYTLAVYCPTGKRIATVHKYAGEVLLWDAIDGHLTKTLPVDGLLLNACFSPDGSLLATVGGARDQTTLWDVASGRKVSECTPVDFDPLSLRFDHVGKRLYVGSFAYESGGRVDILEVPTLKQVTTLGSPPVVPVVAGFDPSSNAFTLGLADATVVHLGPPTYCPSKIQSDSDGLGMSNVIGDVWVSFCGSPLSELLYSSRGDRLVSRSDASTSSWDLTCVPAKPCGKVTNPVLLSPNGEYAITLGGLWDIARNVRVCVLPDNSLPAAFNRTSTLLACRDPEGSVEIRNPGDGSVLRRLPHDSDQITQIAFSPDGGTVGIMSSDGNVSVWDASTGAHCGGWTTELDSPLSLAPSDAGKVLFILSDELLSAWNTAQGTLQWSSSLEVRSDDLGRGPDSSSIKCDQAGRFVFVRNYHDAWIVDAHNGNVLRQYRGLIGVDSELETVAVLTQQGVVRFDSVSSGEPLLQFTILKGDNEWLVTTPEGLFDGPPAVRNKVCYRVGNGLNVLPVDQFFNGFYYPGLMEAILRGERPLPNVKVEPPPTIRIVSPESNIATEQESATVEALIENQGGGIEKPRVKLNGSEYLVDQSPVAEGDARVRWRFTVPLIAGIENVIEVHSAAANGAIESEPGRVVLRCEKPKERPELYMVAVGISDYAEGGQADLACARSDAETLARIFQTRGESFYGHGRVHVSTVLDHEATKAGIHAALEKVAGQAKPQDVFVLTLAGHGVTLGQRYYFIPHEYTGGTDWLDEKVRDQGLPEDELNDWISAVAAQKRILIYDTCQSGSAVSRNASNYERTLEALARRSGCHVIAAAASTEDAQELPDVGHGALTYALMAGLGAADSGLLQNRNAASEDGLVHTLDWFQFASENVPKLTELSLGKKQYVEFKSQADDFPILNAGDKENNE